MSELVEEIRKKKFDIMKKGLEPKSLYVGRSQRQELIANYDNSLRFEVIKGTLEYVEGLQFFTVDRDSHLEVF